MPTMYSEKPFVLLLLFLCVGGLDSSWGAVPTFEEVSIHQGFEETAPNVTEWADNGPSTVSFSGVTDERAFEGKHSYKLDVSIDGGTYHYFGARLPMPAEGDLKMSARVFVAEGTTARVGFGANMVYPPTHHSGCGPVETFEEPTGGWKRVEMDLNARGRAGAHSVIGRETATLDADDVGWELDRWSLFILGGDGKRAIVYVDDIRVEGRGFSESAYESVLDERWTNARKRLESNWLAKWRRRLDEAKQHLMTLDDLPEFLHEDVASLRASVQECETHISAIEERGYASRDEADTISAAVDRMKYGPDTLEIIAQGVSEGRPWVTYTPKAITNVQLSATQFPIPAPVGEALECAGCRGEFESVTAALYAIEDLKGVEVGVSDLVGGESKIPGAAVDVYIVKCWYQAGRGIWPQDDTRLYVPELLLKDADLIRVDHDEQHNYLRNTAEDGTESYVLCSAPESGEKLENVRPIDSPTLLPVDIPRRSLQQFWFRIHIPDDAPAGQYNGAIIFKTASGQSKLPLRVTVYPFDLDASPLTYSIYYRAKLSKDGKPTIGAEHKSEQQYRAEMRDMRDHGVLYPTNYQSWDDQLMPTILDIRRELGMPTDAFYNLGYGTGSVAEPDALEARQQGVKDWLEKLGAYNYKDVYFYGIDEARGERLKSQQAAWAAVQEAGGKTFVACYQGTFEAMGGLLDCAVIAGKPDPSEARKWHAVGSDVFCYAYPQVGNEEPETYRRNFGLVLWKAGYDGAMDYAYQHGFGHIWNDFDHETYRDHNFTYPTVNGIIGTIQWEGFREAVDDVRYAGTLMRCIEEAPPEKGALAAEAWLWLDSVDVESADLYAVREEMADWITRLTE
ncbi:MAG: hypothetical protein R6V12_17525 [Candidatus Hydrogenedentota bacterium]